MVIEAVPTFQNYTQLPRRVPLKVWPWIRLASVILLFCLCGLLFVKPDSGLRLFWNVIVPLLPLVFFIAPGVWRNVCPASMANQTPRVFGFTRGWTAPAWLRNNAYVIAVVLFFGMAATRKVLFNTNGPAMAIALLVWVTTAFVGGFLFKGKSGWCSSMCPLLPVQRLYGQTPFVVSPNSHCQPCLGCTKNCYDFNPKPAYQADVHDDENWSGRRKFFAGAFPGFVLGFLTTAPAHISNAEVYARLGLYMACSAGAFFALEALLHVNASKLAAIYGAAALIVFYWFSARTIVTAVRYYTGGKVIGHPGIGAAIEGGVSVSYLIWPIRGLILILTLIWIARTFRVERLYVEQTAFTAAPVKLAPKATAALKGHQMGVERPQVRFLPDDHAAVATLGASLLEVAEKDGKAIEAGCRMGICGADPVAVLDGMECLSVPESDEISTLRRLGLAESTRMACSARLLTACEIKVSLKPEKGDVSVISAAGYDRTLTSVVVLGNGIAGATAADYVRRGHPDCEIHLVGRESHVLYNRMGISRLIYGRSAMKGLYLLPEDWYDEHRVTAWLNTAASKIDIENNTVRLGTGDILSWDRLILAMGSSSMVPNIDSFGRPGTFVVREASDAMGLRAYAQDAECKQAVIAGAGLLGLEVAHAVRSLGLKVTVLDRGDRLLAKQTDVRAGGLVLEYVRSLGIEVLQHAEARSLLPDNGPVQQIALADNRTLPCDLFVVAIGIRPNSDVAKAAGIEVNRGVMVDDFMRTSAPGVFAAGDVAEHRGMVTGLWPVAVKQAEVAAANALGGEQVVDSEPPVCILKGVGLELTSAGRIEANEDDTTIVLDDHREPSYCKLVVSPENTVVGMIVVGPHPNAVTAALGAVKRGTVVDHTWLDDLRQGNWEVLTSDASNVVA